MPENLEFYSVLGLDPGASIADVKVQFRRMALLFHPDRNDNVEWCQEQLRRLNAAHSVLSDPEAKAAYDARLAPASRADVSERVRASLPADSPQPPWSRTAVPLLFLGLAVFGALTLIVLGVVASRDQGAGLTTVTRPDPSEASQFPSAAPAPQPDPTPDGLPSDADPGGSGAPPTGQLNDNPSRHSLFLAPPDNGAVPPGQHQEEPIAPTAPSDPAAPADQNTTSN